MPKPVPISRSTAMYQEIKEQKKTIAALCDDMDRMTQDLNDSVKAWWIAHMLLGFPPLKGKDRFHDACLRELCRLTGKSPRVVRRWMRMDMRRLAIYTQRHEDGPGAAVSARRRIRG